MYIILLRTAVYWPYKVYNSIETAIGKQRDIFVVAVTRINKRRSGYSVG